MARISSWLCPTEQHRARAREAGARVRTARSIAAVACGISLVATAPFMSWWYLVLFALVALNLALLEKHLATAERPELMAAQASLTILAVLALGAILSGGEQSPAFTWLILPVATTTTWGRKRAAEVVVVGAGITALVMFGVAVGADAQAVV